MALVAPIAVALDAPDLETLRAWAVATGPVVAAMKIGLEAFLRDGRSAVSAAREGAPDTNLFLDLKLHDIPATVGGAARSLADIAPKFLTVHASGGRAMIEAAATALPETFITAVTVLTSLGARELDELGWDADPTDLVARLAVLAVSAGARAIVCSPLEVAAVRAAVGADIVLITPGVRPADSALGDQARVATPAAALAAGADLLVIGRPITAAPNPGAAAAAIAAELLETQASGGGDG